MTEPTILVTGAAGKTGAATVRELLRLGSRVRAQVRREDARSAALRQAGAEIVVADLFDSAQMANALRGVQRAYFVPPMAPQMLHTAAVFAAAARDAKLESVAYMSQWISSPSHPALMTRQTWLMDQIFAMLPGIGVTTLNPGYFADNYLRFIDFAAHLGVFPVPLRGEGRNAPPSNEDIARVAAAVLRDPAKHAGKTYRPTGPALLSVTDMTRIVARVLNRRVLHVNMPFWMLTKAARLQGVSADEIVPFRHYSKDHDDGAFAHGAPTTDVLDVTGAPAEDFETTARRYAALPFARRSAGNFARMLGQFLIMPAIPGLNLRRAERAAGVPTPSGAQYAMGDAAWQGSHAGAASRAVRPLLSVAA